MMSRIQCSLRRFVHSLSCQIPRSFLIERLWEQCSVLGSWCEKAALICRQRVEKSSFIPGNVQIQRKWLGNITKVSLLKVGLPDIAESGSQSINIFG